MKMTRRSFIPLLCVLPSGCVLFKQENRPALLAFIAARAGEAATIAVANDIQENPGHRGAYETCVQALNGLMGVEGYSSADFRAALAALPIKEFRGVEGALLLTGTILVFDILTMAAYDIRENDALMAVTIAVRDGIQQGLTFQTITPTARAITKTKTPVGTKVNLVPAYVRKV